MYAPYPLLQAVTLSGVKKSNSAMMPLLPALDV